MSDLYPYLVDVSHEYSVATGQQAKFAILAFEAEAINPDRLRIKVTAYPYDSLQKLSARSVPLLEV